MRREADFIKEFRTKSSLYPMEFHQVLNLTNAMNEYLKREILYCISWKFQYLFL